MLGKTQPILKVTENKWGRKFEVRCEMVTPDGRNPCLRTVWQVTGETVPRLVTAYPG
jgi:filamentous hemagglutinin